MSRTNRNTHYRWVFPSDSSSAIFPPRARSGSCRDDGLRPALERLALFAPAVLGWIPGPLVPQAKRDEAERLDVEPLRRDLAGEVRVAAVVPLLVDLDRHDLAGDQLPDVSRSQRDLAL